MMVASRKATVLQDRLGRAMEAVGLVPLTLKKVTIPKKQGRYPG